jgi:hypothetical protein
MSHELTAVKTGDVDFALENIQTLGEQTKPAGSPRRFTLQKSSSNVSHGGILSFLTASEIKELDVDGDGKISEDEIHDFIRNASMEKFQNQAYKKLLIAISILLVIMTATAVGLTFVAIELAKESHIEDSVMVDLDGEPVQCASNVMNVENGALIDRESQGLVSVSAQTEWTRHSLTSRVPDRYLEELQTFSFTSPEGGTRSMDVLEFRREPRPDALCGSVVVLTTPSGEFILDDEHLYHSGGSIEVTGSFDVDDDSPRRHRRGRRLRAEKLEGLFNFIEDSDFECVTEWQGQEDDLVSTDPVKPYSFVSFTDQPCVRMEAHASTDICTSSSGPTAYQKKPGYDPTTESMRMISRVMVTEDRTITIDYPSNHPLQAQVKIQEVSDDGQVHTLSYQIAHTAFNKTLTKLYCEEQVKPETGVQYNSSSSFIWYIGDTTENGKGFRKFAIHHRNHEISGMFGGIEYWEDVETSTLYKLAPESSSDMQPLVGTPETHTYVDWSQNMTVDEVQNWIDQWLPAEPFATTEELGCWKHNAHIGNGTDMVWMPPIIDNGNSEKNVVQYASMFSTPGNWHPFDLSEYVSDAFTRYWSVQRDATNHKSLLRPTLNPNGTYPDGCPTFPNAVKADNILRQVWPDLYHAFVADAEDICASEERRLSILTIEECANNCVEESGSCEKGTIGTGVSFDVDAKICTISSEMVIHEYTGSGCVHCECTNNIGCNQFVSNPSGYGGYWRAINPAFCHHGGASYTNNCQCHKTSIAGGSSDVEFSLKVRSVPRTKKVMSIPLPGSTGRMSYGPFAQGEVKLVKKANGVFDVEGSIGAGYEAQGCKKNPLWIQHASAAFNAEIRGDIVVKKNSADHVNVGGKLTVAGSAGLYEGKRNFGIPVGYCGCNWITSYTTVKGCPNRLIEASIEGSLQLEFENVDTSCAQSTLDGEFKVALKVAGLPNIQASIEGSNILQSGCINFYD